VRISRPCCRPFGHRPDTTIVLYGDNNNWFAAWAYWQLKLYGHKDVRILDGGRKYWLDHGLPVTTDETVLRGHRLQLPEPDFALRAFRDDILPRLDDPELVLVDVRSPAEFNGEIIAPPGMSETAQRAGHIPGAASIPWAQTVKEDGTFKSADDLTRAVRGQGRHARQGRHRLLPDRRALLALLVRPARAARLPTGPQLRRQLDRVGQPGQRSDREDRSGAS
jgi:3-mercaptopyruvate sulfurtransferase SseA